MLDPNEAPEGFTAFAADARHPTCTGCDYDCTNPGNRPTCEPWDRADGQYVIFLKKSEDDA